MAIKNQHQDDKHPYASPTTPGLYITLRAYIIELVCLNINNKIGPRFWADKKYWGPKFRREVKGVSNVLEQLGELDVLTETAFVQVVKSHNIKALCHKNTVKKVVASIRKRKLYLENQRKQLKQKKPQQTVDAKKNSTFVEIGRKGILAKIREIENG